MLSQNSRLRALKSLLYSYYVDSKMIYGIFIGILTGLLISRMLISSSGNSGSSLNDGLVNGAFTLLVSIIVITSNSELLKKFSFPVDRSMLALSHIILILVFPLIMLLTSCGFFLLESLVAGFLTNSVQGFFFTWVITKSSFLTGFMTSYITMVFIAAVTWFVFAWFYRHKIVTSVVGGVFMLTFIYSGELRQALLMFADDVFFKSSPGLFFLKLLLLTLVSFALGYIPIKRMEVTK